MPIYEYQCTTCGAVADVKHGFGETPETACARCGAAPLKRLFNAAGIVFKGAGFYVTDSRTKSASDGSSKPATAPSDGAASSDATPKPESVPKTESAPKSESASKSESAAAGTSPPKSDAAA